MERTNKDEKEVKHGLVLKLCDCFLVNVPLAWFYSVTQIVTSAVRTILKGNLVVNFVEHGCLNCHG